MTRKINRAFVGALTVLLAVAALDVSGALAQALPTNDGTITSTACSVGTITECGKEIIQKCEWRFELDLNIIVRTGGISFGTYECKEYGFKTLYKDAKSTLGSCPTYGGGSQGTGLTGTRGSGDDGSDDDMFCLE